MPARNPNHRERGSALLVAMLMLALMGIIGIASLDTVMRDRQVAGFNNLSQSALYAADAGIAQSLELLRTEILGEAISGTCLSTDLMDAAIGERTLPNGAYFEADPTAPGPSPEKICMLASAEPCPETDSSIEVGQPVYLLSVWNVRAQGVAPGGATSRIHATAERCHVFHY